MMNNLHKIDFDNNRKKRDTDESWSPDESYKNKLRNLINRGYTSLFEKTPIGEAEPLTEEWVERNYHEIIAYYAQGHSSKVVSSLMGVPFYRWEEAAQTSRLFSDLIQLGGQAQLLFFEELRNQQGRGTFKGNVAVTMHALDRQHADTYWGKAGIAAPKEAPEEELDLEEANQVIESFGIDPDGLELD